MATTVNAMTLEELDTGSEVLARSALWLRALGQYQTAASCLAQSRLLNQAALAREAALRQDKSRQLSLCPPGAYDEQI